MANQSNSFGIFSGTGSSGASGVTSVTAGTGLTATPNPITATGTISLDNRNGLISTFEGANGPSNSLAAAARIQMYDATTFPSTTFDLTTKGSITFGVQQTPTTDRFGLGGCSWGDEIQVVIGVETNCSSGAFLAAQTTGGIFGQTTFTPSPAVITCDGTTQTQTLTMNTIRVGHNSVPCISASTDFIQISYVYTGSGGTVRFNQFDVTTTQYSD